MNLTLVLIITTVLISIVTFPEGVRAIDSIRRIDLFHKLKFNAYQIIHRKEWWRMITSGFLHASWGHLFFNMLALYFFGDLVEQYFGLYWGTTGKILFFGLYIIAIPISSIYSLIKHKNNHYYNAVGASGAVSAILFASILFDPWIGIYLFFIPIPIPGIIFGPLYLAYSQYMGRKSIDNIGHDAHFWGAIVGFLLPVLLKPNLMKIFIERVLGG
jgi:membrane associated rhomboid family serine protease